MAAELGFAPQVIAYFYNASPDFFGWVFGLGNDAMILTPQSVAKQYKKMLKDVFDMYVVKKS